MKPPAALLCLALADPAAGIDQGVSGLWYNPAQSGHGFAVTVVDTNSVAVAWYTFNSLGRPVWVSSLMSETSPGVLTGSASYFDGMRFGAFNPATNVTYPWGTLKLTFAGCDQATVEYNGTLTYQDGSGFGAGSMPLRKLVNVRGVDCGGAAPTPQGAVGVYAGLAKIAGSPTFDEAYALLESNGNATVFIPEEATMTGTYTVQGSQISFALSAQTVAPLVFLNNAGTANFTGSGTLRERDYIGGNVAGGSAGSGEFALTYLGLSTRSASLGEVAGTYTDDEGSRYTVTASGSIGGTDNFGCAIAGIIAPKPAGLNAYSVSVTVNNCGTLNGLYTGSAVAHDYARAGDGRGLAVALRGPATAIATTLHR